MPMENEVKYVLRRAADLEAAIMQAAVRAEEIWQGYLNAETRLRRVRDSLGEGYEFTFKRRLPDGRNVEIPADIEQGDYMRLWPDCAEKLRKRRFKIKDGEVSWDVDLFLGQKDEVYFALAEAEMPVDMDEPPAIPAVLASRIAFAVPREDDRFSSRKLSDPAHAAALAAELAA